MPSPEQVQVLNPVFSKTIFAEPAKIDLSWLERAFRELPEGTLSDDVLPLDHPERPERGYRILDNRLEKWIPVYAKPGGSDVLSVVRALSGLQPPQIGWRVEYKTLTDACRCSSGHFKTFGNRLVHVDGCGRPVESNPEESPEQWRERMLSIQRAPDDEYLNGMYPTLGGLNDKDPKSWITRGRSEYKQRTKGMITWGSSKKDDASWNGNTLGALDKIQNSERDKQTERIRLAAEKWSKKSAPRKLGEL